MIDGLKIIDVFDYKGIQGFLHSDFSVSSIIELPEYSNIELMNDLEFDNYNLKKEQILNSTNIYSKGALLPPIKAQGGTIYQYINTSISSIKEELEIIKHSNKSKSVFTSLLDDIIKEEQSKIINDAPKLNKTKSYLVLRTYLSQAEEKRAIFEYNKKKYKTKEFVNLYTKVLLENNDVSEQIKEKFVKFFEPLFTRQVSALKNFNITSFDKSTPFNLKLSENPLSFTLPDILGQVNILRNYFGFPEIMSLDQNKNINLQIFDTSLKCDNDRLRINTGKPLYLVYNQYNELSFKIYEDDNANVVVNNIKTNISTYYENSVVFYNKDEYFDEEGLLVLKRDLQNTVEDQIVEKYFLDKGFRIEIDDLYKNIQVFSISSLPDNIQQLTGEYLFEKLFDKIHDKSIKFNITMNFNKSPVSEWKSKFYLMGKGWKIIKSIPSIKNILYETKSVNEKIMAVESATELLRKGIVKFVETQMFITIISYGDEDLYNDISNVLQSSEFDFGCDFESHLASTIIFASAAPLAYSKSTMTMDKEMLLTSDDFVNMMSLNNGSGRFSLEDPTLIGISNSRKINFINSFDPRIEAPNGIVIGSTGSGKSFTKTFELIKLLALGEKPFIAIVDRGGSFINFVQIFGGKAITLDLSNPKNNINPFVYKSDFKEAILALDEQNSGLEDIEILKTYKDIQDNDIFEDVNNRLYAKDEHGNFQPYIDTSYSPQTKLGFFATIIESMTKNSDPAFKTITIGLLKDLLKNNTQTFKSKQYLNKEAVLIVDKDFEYDKKMNYNDIAGSIIFDPSELMTGTDEYDNITSHSWTYIQEGDKCLLKNRRLIGKELEFDNTKILILQNTIEFMQESYYFTTKDIQEKLSEIDGFEQHVKILNSYVDFNVYGNLFNGPPVLNFDNELLWTIDMGEETPDDLSNVILQSLNIILWESILSARNKSRKKMIVFDEVHHILSNAEDIGAAEAIAYMYRTIRKHGGGIHILSQASGDILKKDGDVNPNQQPIFAGIKANAMYKYVIGINADDAPRTKEDLQLTDEEIKRIVDFSSSKTKIASKRGLIYVKTKAFKGFINIQATPTIYAIATTKKEEKNLLEAIEKELLENNVVMDFKKSFNLNDTDFKNVLTIVKIKIFSSLFPSGIKNVYGENTESVFINKHIDSQSEGSDKFLKGFRDYLLQNNKGFLVSSIIENEIEKLRKNFG